MGPCAACGSSTIPHTAQCLECGAARLPVRPTRQRLILSGLGEADRPRLRALLAVLTGQSQPRLERTLALDSCELVATIRPDQKQRLTSALTTTGVSVHVSDRFVPGPELVLRWRMTRQAVAKLTLSALLAGVATWLDNTPAAVGAGLGLLVVGLRAVQVAPRSLEIPDREVAELLGVVDASLEAEAISLRPTLRHPPVISTLRDVLKRFAELAWLVRADGNHLGDPELLRVDRQLRQTMHNALRLAAVCDRLAEAPETTAAGETVGGHEPVHEGLLARLQRLAEQLQIMHSQLAQLQASAITRRELGRLREAVSESQVAIETAVEMAGTEISP